MATASSIRDFSGTSQYLDTSDTSTYNFTTGDVTALAWAIQDTATQNGTIMGAFAAGASGWALLTLDASSDQIAISKAGVGNITSTYTLSTNWSGISAAVDNGTDVEFTQISTTKSIANQTVAGANNTVTTGASLKIGATDSGTTQELDGHVAYAQVFNRLLSQNEAVNALFSPGSVTNGLIGYWPIKGGLSPEPDLSTTGSDATNTSTSSVSAPTPPCIPQQMPIM